MSEKQKIGSDVFTDIFNQVFLIDFSIASVYFKAYLRFVEWWPI